MPGRCTPQAPTQMLQSQQLHAQLLQRHMTQPQTVYPQQLHLQLSQMSQHQMTQPRISQPQGCPSHWSQTQILQSQAQTLQCQPQMLQSQTQPPWAYAQMLLSHMHEAEQTYESCRAVLNTIPRQSMPSQKLQQLLALMSVPDQGQGQSEHVPGASANQGPWATDQCGTGFLHKSSRPPQLVTTRPHLDAAWQLQTQVFAQPPPLALDQHGSACQSAQSLQQSQTVDSRSLQELIVNADQQLMMTRQLSGPIQSADDLLFRLNSMGPGSIIAEQVAESKDVGRGSSAFTGHLDSHNGPSDFQMVQLLQSSTKEVAELLQSTRKRLSKAEFGKSSIPVGGAASPPLHALKVSFTVCYLDTLSFIHAFIH